MIFLIKHIFLKRTSYFILQKGCTINTKELISVNNLIFKSLLVRTHNTIKKEPSKQVHQKHKKYEKNVVKT
jgi:hypothetical protein